jgi:hypothetical protein
VRSRLTSAALVILNLVLFLCLSSCGVKYQFIDQAFEHLFVLMYGVNPPSLLFLGTFGMGGPVLNTGVTLTDHKDPNSMMIYSPPATVSAPSSSSTVLVVSEAFVDVGVYDTTTGAQIASMPVDGNPFDLVKAPGQTTIYAVIYPSNGASPAVAVIDATTWTISGTIPLPAGTYPQYAAISQDGATLYVNNAAPQYSPSPNAPTSIFAIDTASKAVTSTITLPASVDASLFGSYTRLQLSPDGTLLYAVGTNAVEAIDTLTLLPVSIIGFNPGIFPETSFPEPHIVFSSDGTLAYVAVAGPRGPSVAVINTSTSQVTNSISIGGASSYLTDITLTLDNSVLATFDSTTTTLYPINTATGQVGAGITATFPQQMPDAFLSIGQ